MKNRRLLLLIILLLLFLTSIGTYVYVQRQGAEGITEQAEASELRQSDLEIVEQQLQANTIDSDAPGIETAQQQPEAEEEVIVEEVPPALQEGIGQGGSTTQEEFVIKKAPEIGPNAAQTTVNLTITEGEDQ